jgi:hypothetical protein
MEAVVSRPEEFHLLAWRLLFLLELKGYVL